MKKCACVGDYCEYWQYARWKTENTIRMLSEDLNIGKTACQDILPGVIDRKKLNARLVPRCLTLEQKGWSFCKLRRTFGNRKKEWPILSSIIAGHETLLCLLCPKKSNPYCPMNYIKDNLLCPYTFHFKLRHNFWGELH